MMRRLRMRSRGLAVRVWRIVVLGLVVAAVVTACGGAQATLTPEPSGITVRFDGETCVYHGPARVPTGRIPVVLDVQDQTSHEEYSMGVATLDEGKTLEDLKAWPWTSGAPLWLHDHGGVGAEQGATGETTVTLFEGPLYIVCFTASPDRVAGVLGPIAIGEQ
jgi:hypothetical protein